MKSKKALFPIAGISLLAILALTLVWGSLVGAAPARVAGTVTADDFVSANLDLAVADRVIDVTVDDFDLNVTLFVGEGPAAQAADSPQLLIEFIDPLGAFETIVVDLSDPTPVAGYAVRNVGDIALPTVDRNGDGNINSSDFEVIAPDAADIGVGETAIGPDLIRPLRVANAVAGRIQFEAQDVVNASSVFVLRHATSTREVAIVTVEGDNPDGIFTLALLETDDAASGNYTGGPVVAATDVIMDIGAINGEQVAISGGAALQNYEDEAFEGGDRADNDLFSITLGNPPLQDGDGDGDLTDEITITSGSVRFDAIVDADAGIITVQATNPLTADPDDAADDDFTVSYSGSRQVTATLAFAPVQDSGNGGGVDATDLAWILPGGGDAGALLQINAFDPATGALTVGVRTDIGAAGTVTAITYSGSESDADQALLGPVLNTETFDVAVVNQPIQDRNGDGVVDENDVTVVSAGWNVDVGGVNADTISLTATADHVAGEQVVIQYAIRVPSNPQNALDPAVVDPAARPIVEVSNLGRVTITYTDADPAQDVEAFVDVENDDPSFSGETPTSGSSVANLDNGLSILVTDLGSEVDTATIQFKVTTNAAPVLDGNTVTIEGDDVTTSGANSEVTASVSKDVLETALGIDLDDVTVAPDVSWWVQASDNASNAATSDAVADDPADAATLGNQPYSTEVDRTAPGLDEALTGDWWDPDADEGERMKGDRRIGVGQFLPGVSMNTSIRVGFTDELDADSIQATDFEVDGAAVDDAMFFADSPTNVFLVVAAMPADANPTVELVGTVTDAAGNSAATGTIEAVDGIAPTPVLTPSPTLSQGDVTITVSTDEAIRTPTSGPSRLTVQARDPADPDTALDELEDADGVVVAEGAATRTPGQNEWSYSLAGLAANTYTVLVDVDDSRRNRRTVGQFDPQAEGATIFEVDDDLPDPGTTPVQAAAGADPTNAGFTDPFVVTIDWSAEIGEYPGDTHGDVTLTKVELDGNDVSGLVNVRGGNIFSISLTSISLGAHTLTYRGSDEAGNADEEDRTLEFNVTEPVAFALELSPGMNLFSIPGAPTNGSIDAIFGDVPEVDLVFTMDGDRWLLAFRSSPTANFEGDLTTIDAKHAYWARSNGAPTVNIPIPPLGAQQILPSIPVRGNQWNLVPIISLLPQIQGDELDPDGYLGGNWSRAFTFDSGAWVRIVPGADPDDDATTLTDAVQIGRGYWVWFVTDDRIVP